MCICSFKAHWVAVALLLLSTSTLADIFGTGSNQFEIDFVTIGNPGNEGDLSGIPRGAGAVDYVYEIGKYEVSRGMVEKASLLGGLQLSLDPMDFVTGGPRADMPATGLSWNEAARFVNWLNTSEGYAPAYNFFRDPGSSRYAPNANILLWGQSDPGYDPENPFRNTDARYVLPDVDEWYKAAYYDPDLHGGQGGYWNYPTGRLDPPTPVASGRRSGTAVYRQRLNQGPADVDFAGGLSPYGVMGMGGNVWEWEETEVDLVNDDPSGFRAARGGRWFNAGTGHQDVFSRDDDDRPWYEPLEIGFRVAALPQDAPVTTPSITPTTPPPSTQPPFVSGGNNGDIDFQISPGVGKFTPISDVDNYLIVEEIANGYRVRAHESAEDLRLVPEFTARWLASRGQWYRFEAKINSVDVGSRALDLNNEPLAPDLLVPNLTSTDKLSFGTTVFQPTSGWFSFSWQPEQLNTDLDVSWEFKAVPIDPPKPGDANADGRIGLEDFLAVSRNFDKSGTLWSSGDFNGSGNTDFLDFLVVSRSFGRTANPITVPEPSAQGLILTALLMLLLARTRRNRR